MPAPASPAPPSPTGQPASAGLVARVALVVGTTTGGTGAHVRMLAAGFAERGIDVSVLGPSSAEAAFGFGALAGVTFSAVEFGDRPRPGDAAAVLRLRRLLSHGTAPTGRPEVVHAHGLRAGALTAIALAGVRAGRRRPGGGRARALVVTVHNAPPAGRGPRVLIYRLLERVVARRADLVLCVSPDLEARMRAAGARRIGRAIVPPPTEATPPTEPPHPTHAATPSTEATQSLWPRMPLRAHPAM